MMLSRSHWSPLAALVLAVSQLFAGPALACKDRIYPPHFPPTELASFEHVYVVHVEKIDWVAPPGGSWYAPPFTFEGRIVKSLKGPLKPGGPVRATTSTDEAHAVCSISLETGKTYLLMLNGSSSPYVLPRFGSLHVASDDARFEAYVRDIAHASSRKSRE
jgi:hypothetical protein